LSKTVELFVPIVRFAGHSLASAVGFVILLVVTLIPIFALRFLAWLGMQELAQVFNWNWLEIGILYLDIGLYVLTVLLWAYVFCDRRDPCRKEGAERAMKELKQAFIQAFKEGLVVYFSPFTGLGRAIRDLRPGSKVHDIFAAPQH